MAKRKNKADEAAAVSGAAPADDPAAPAAQSAPATPTAPTAATATRSPVSAKRTKKSSGHAPKRSGPATPVKKQRPKRVKIAVSMTNTDRDLLEALKLRARILVPATRKPDVIRAALHSLEKVTDARLRALLTPTLN